MRGCNGGRSCGSGKGDEREGFKMRANELRDVGWARFFMHGMGIFGMKRVANLMG